jgi:hypothetical protein
MTVEGTCSEIDRTHRIDAESLEWSLEFVPAAACGVCADAHCVVVELLVPERCGQLLLTFSVCACCCGWTPWTGPGEKSREWRAREGRAVGGSVGILFFCPMVEDDLADGGGSVGILYFCSMVEDDLADG